jgi:hypothetical protein
MRVEQRVSHAPEWRSARGESAMPNEISIQGLTPISSSGDTTTEPKGDTPVSHSVSAPVAAPQPYVNPSLRLDAALGLVVIEFRDDSGTITSSIPSQRQLEAYRQHEQPPPTNTDTRASADTEAMAGTRPTTSPKATTGSTVTTGTPGATHPTATVGPTGTFGPNGRPVDRSNSAPRAAAHPVVPLPSARGGRVLPAHKA